MEVEIRLGEVGDGDELSELTEWLNGEDGLRGSAHMVSTPPSSSELGGLPELVSVLLNGGTGAILASSLKTWLLTKRRMGKISVTAGDRTVEIDLESNQDIASDLARLLETAKDV